jgi:hypothetical protein
MKPQVEEINYTLELVPHPKTDNIEAEKRRSDVLELLKQMHLRAKKKGRPTIVEEELEDAA